ncbi:hypothetical protein [Winogradskyella undariae]|uniref:hypothetical protein n=1 Tax=Winogradskyella undariae TaxID=1285465 RepID=UPI0015CA8BB5|nr:hypothetical protein [Winogradskyella undariae]
MIEKDYIMRLIQTFFDAINRIVNSIDNEDIEGAKIQLNNLYGLLGNKEDYFLNTKYEEVIEFLN